MILTDNHHLALGCITCEDQHTLPSQLLAPVLGHSLMVPKAASTAGSSTPSEPFDGAIDIASMDCAKIMEFVYVSR